MAKWFGAETIASILPWPGRKENVSEKRGGERREGKGIANIWGTP